MLQAWAEAFSIAGVVLTFCTTVATLLILAKALRMSAQSNELAWRGKRSDALFHCNERYSRIWSMRYDSSVASEPRRFYDLFWSLQLDQFHHWQGGFLDTGVFQSWMVARNREWMVDAPLGTMSFRDGYLAATKDWAPGLDFQKLMNLALSEDTGAIAAVNAYLEREQPAGISKAHRWAPTSPAGTKV